jgi:sulfite exporter TauE/SafE
MRENLSYLFMAGLLMGSGPCLGFCAPFLVAYSGAQKKSPLESLGSYAIFSMGKMMSYALLGFFCALGTLSLQSDLVSLYTKKIYVVLGVFIILLGMASAWDKQGFLCCASLNKGSVRNVGLVGFLVGLSPCLPLIGILQYIVLVARSPWQAAGLTVTFGAGTVLSPVILLMVFSGTFARFISQWKILALIVRYAFSVLVIYFGLTILMSGLR